MTAKRTKFTRRRFVQGAGVAGLAGFTGWSAGGADGRGVSVSASADPESERSRQDVLDRAFVATDFQLPADAQFNVYGQTNYPGKAAAVLFDPLTIFDPSGTEFVPAVASDWSVDEQRMTITIADDYAWHDGDRLTAEDVATKLKLDLGMEFEIGDHVSDVEATDEETVELTLVESTNPDVLEQIVLPTGIETKRDVYREFVEAFDAATDDELEDVRTELLQWSLEEAVGNGAFELADRNQQEFTLERFPEHPFAADINFSRCVLEHAPEGQDRWRGIASGNRDGEDIMGTPPEVVDTFPDSITRFTYAQFAYAGGVSLQFQHAHELFGQREVRQAVAYALDQHEAAQAGFHDEAAEVDPPVGFPTEIGQDWLEESIDQYVPYRRDQDRAAALLEDAGFTREEGSWHTPDGDRFGIEVTAPSGWADALTTMQVVASQLREFGLQAEVRPVEVTSFLGSVLPEGDYELVKNWWGGGNPHPYFGFSAAFNSLETEYMNYPAEVSVPPIGEPDGEERTVTPSEMVAELGRTADDETARELVRELAWVFNYDLPKLPMMTRIPPFYIDTERWAVPDEDTPIMKAGGAPHVLPSRGELQATPEN